MIPRDGAWGAAGLCRMCKHMCVTYVWVCVCVHVYVFKSWAVDSQLGDKEM